MAVLATNESGSWRDDNVSALLWVQDAVYGFDNFGTATYKDNVLYAPSKGDDKVYAVDASNGSVIWSHQVRQCDGSPYIDGDVIYVGECSGPNGERTPSPKAMALNRTTGEEAWHYVEPGGYEWVGSPVVNGEFVYYTTYGGGVYAMNKTNGKPVWHEEIGIIVGSVAYDSGVVFISAWDPPSQYALNATTGAVLWHHVYGKSWDTSPVIYDGMVIQAIRNVDVNVWTAYVLNETTGEIMRSFPGKGSTATPLVHEGKVFIPSNDWKMWAYNLTSGEELWHTANLHNGTFQNYEYCSPATSGGAIFYQSLNGTFYVISEMDGSILWSYPLGGLGFGSISIGDGCVFVANDAGLYAFRIGPGSGDWPMFCQNNFHRSSLEEGVEYVRWPLTQPQHFGKVANTWVSAKFTWSNKTIASAAIAWRIYFFDGQGKANATDVKVFYVEASVSTQNDVLVNPDYISRISH